MTGGFRRYLSTLLAGLLLFAGTATAATVVGSSDPAPAGATSPTGWTAYVVSSADDAVIPVDTATHAVGAPIPVGSGPSAIAVTPDGITAYVTDEGTTTTAPGFVTPIDLSTGTPGTAIPVGSGPDAIAITPDGRTAWVGNYNDGTVTPVDLVTDVAGAPLAVGGSPTSITITPDGSAAYVGRDFSSGIRLDLTTRTVAAGTAPSGFAAAITPDGTTVVATSPQVNQVNVFTTATATGVPVAALNQPQGAAVTPDGSTAYVAYRPFTTNRGALLPIPLGDPNSPGIPIGLGSNSAFAVAITPDGATALVTDLTGGTVVPVDLASGTAGTPIPLGPKGTTPFALAIAPDQAPVAHLHVSALGDSTMGFDASASTVAHGTIASYAWDFGDGTSETTSTPIVTHSYASAAPTTVASVTETDSSGTSTADVYTGQSVAKNGSPGAVDRATVYTAPFLAAAFYPTVSSVTPDVGSTYGPTTVTVTGTSFWSRTEVYVGGEQATDVTVNPDQTSLTATLPPQSAGTYDIVVTSADGFGEYFGSSATVPADQFTYSASLPPATMMCATSACPLPVLQYGPTTVTSTLGPNCSSCTYSASVVNATPATCGTVTTGFCCPNGMAFQQPQITVGTGGPTVTTTISVIGSPLFSLSPDQLTVCAQEASFSTAGPAPTTAARSSGAGQPASTAGGTGQNVLVKKCTRKAVAPCLRSVVVTGGRVDTTVLLPADASTTLTVGPQRETIKKLLPRKGAAPGSTLTIVGTDLNQVTAVYLDGVPAGARLLGGLQAPVVSATPKKLVVTIPAGVSSGYVTLVGPSGLVTSLSTFPVT